MAETKRDNTRKEMYIDVKGLEPEAREKLKKSIIDQKIADFRINPDLVSLQTGVSRNTIISWWKSEENYIMNKVINSPTMKEIPDLLSSIHGGTIKELSRRLMEVSLIDDPKERSKLMSIKELLAIAAVTFNQNQIIHDKPTVISAQQKYTNDEIEKKIIDLKAKIDQDKIIETQIAGTPEYEAAPVEPPILIGSEEIEL